MINDLTLHNFQAHDKTHIEFSPGINVIVGDNDNGKSSVARALYWLFMNRPSGDEFIKWGENQCSVKSTVNNKKIKREKGPNKNKYVIDGKEFNAVRSDVPGELQNIAKITSTNIQMEDDPQFLLSSSPSEVARKLNEVVGLDNIDNSIQHPNKIIRQMNTSINHIQKDIQEKEKQKNKLENINWIEKKNEELDNIESYVSEYESQINEIDSIVDDLKEQSTILQKQVYIENLSSKINELQDIQSQINDLNEEKRQINYSISVLQKCLTKINSLQSVEGLSTKIEELEDVCKQHSDIKSHLDSLSKSIRTIESYTEEVNNIQSEANNLRKEFKKEQRKLGVCPTCERPFT